MHDSKDGGGRNASGTAFEEQLPRTNIGHIRVKMSGTYFPVRVEEHKALMSEGWEDLKGTKYDWLTNLGNLSRKRQCEFKVLRESTLKTARAWAIKALAMRLWNYVSRIKMLKIRSRGFRNKARYKNAIYFHLGGLDLYPEGGHQLEFTHSI